MLSTSAACQQLLHRCVRVPSLLLQVPLLPIHSCISFLPFICRLLKITSAASQQSTSHSTFSLRCTMIESPWFEKLCKNLQECFLEWSSHSIIRLTSVFRRSSSLYLYLYVLDSLNQGCKPWLSRIRFHATFVGKTAGKITLLRFRCALSFHLSKRRSCVQSFDSFQANKIQLHVTNLGHARLCGSLGKERYYFKENFGEKC